MREWVYTYKTSEGFRHEGEMRAPCKDDVYAELRKQGIRAIKVTERIKPIVRRGIRGLRKRDWFLIVGVSAVVLSLLLTAGLATVGMRQTGRVYSSAMFDDAAQLPRHQLPGVDVWAVAQSTFEHPSEVWLARYAQPGVIIGDAMSPDELSKVIDDLIENMDNDIVVLSGDSDDVAELKGIVMGLKAEARMQILGGRSVDSVVEFFDARQRMEAAYVDEVVRGSGTNEEKIRKLNAMGLPENAVFPQR